MITANVYESDPNLTAISSLTTADYHQLGSKDEKTSLTKSNVELPEFQRCSDNIISYTLLYDQKQQNSLHSDSFDLTLDLNKESTVCNNLDGLTYTSANKFKLMHSINASGSKSVNAECSISLLSQSSAASPDTQRSNVTYNNSWISNKQRNEQCSTKKPRNNVNFKLLAFQIFNKKIQPNKVLTNDLTTSNMGSTPPPPPSRLENELS